VARTVEIGNTSEILIWNDTEINCLRVLGLNERDLILNESAIIRECERKLCDKNGYVQLAENEVESRSVSCIVTSLRV
jgi:hypothetical protein